MVKINPKNLTRLAAFAAALFCLALIIPLTRPLVMPVLKAPLYIFNGIRENIGGIIFYRRNLLASRNLQDQIDFLKKELSDKKELASENARLRRLLDFKQSLGYRVIACAVIGRDPSNWTSTIIVDRGASRGIKKGYVCVTFSGLVGRVIETSASTSTVMLINDPNISVSAVLQRSRQEGLVSGSLGGILLMKYLPRDADVNVSDAVVTSGLSPAFPRGLPIGTVVKVREDLSSLSRYAVVKPAVDLSALEEVLIIIP